VNASTRTSVSRLVRWLLGVPLFAKIVVANGVLVGGLGAVALFVAPALHVEANEGWVAAAWAAGVVAVIAVNGLLVRLALRPIRNVEAAARRVEAGELDARVPASPLADREIARVTQVLNRMLDSLEASRERQLDLSGRILEAEEGERKRISAELLDETAQLMSASLLHLRLAARHAAEQHTDGEAHPRTRAALDSARTELLSALAGIQRIARGLRPPELDELGPVAALETQARRLTAGTPVQVEFAGDRIEPWLDPATGLAFYRIFQEGLVNAVVHAHPRRIRVELELADSRIRAIMSDDGTGFDPEGIASRPERHVGILRMIERARHAGGRASIESAPGEGTRLLVELPRRPAPVVPGRARAASLHPLERTGAAPP
jgi:two-component system, NarL family, sensor histidine kinase UhpB